MSKPCLTVFMCTSKDCSRAWRRICDDSPRKWLKHHFHEAGVPGKIEIIKTDCMDRCDEAACVCLVHGERARLEIEVRSDKDLGRLLSAALDVMNVPWRVGDSAERHD